MNFPSVKVRSTNNKYKYQLSNLWVRTLSDLSSSKSLAILLLRARLQSDSTTERTNLLFPFINYQNESSLSDHLHKDDQLDNYENMENTFVEKKRKTSQSTGHIYRLCRYEDTGFPLTWASYSSVFFSESLYAPNCNTHKNHNQVRTQGESTCCPIPYIKQVIKLL